MRLYKEQSVNWYKWAVISRSFGIPRECDEGEGDGERRIASKRMTFPGNGERSATCAMLDRRNGSKPMASIVLPNVFRRCSDTSNLARWTIRRLILINESPSATWISRWIYLQSSFSQAGFYTPFLVRIRSFRSFDIEFLSWQRQITDLCGRNESRFWS